MSVSQILTASEPFTPIFRGNKLTAQIENSIRDLIEKAFGDTRLTHKRLDFIKYNLQEKYGKTWQLVQFPVDYEYGKSFSTNTDVAIEFRMAGTVFIFWQTKIVTNNE